MTIQERAEQIAQAAIRGWFGDPDGFKNMTKGQQSQSGQGCAQDAGIPFGGRAKKSGDRPSAVR